MVQFLINLPQAIRDSLSLTFCQGPMTTASGGITVYGFFQWRVAKQVGMEEYASVASCLQLMHRRYLEHLARVNQAQRGLLLLLLLPAKQCVEVARQAKVIMQFVTRQVDKPHQRMQRFLSREFVKLVYRNDVIHIFISLISNMFLSIHSAKLPRFCWKAPIQITDRSITFTDCPRLWKKCANFAPE